MHFMGFEGIKAGYFIIFIISSSGLFNYWSIMKSLVPEYKHFRLVIPFSL